MTKLETLPVLFRTIDGEVTAFFPTLPGTYDPYTMTCYAHIGQHGSAHVDYVRKGRPATPEEYASLYAELRRIDEREDDPGRVRLVVKHRITPAMTKARKREGRS
jgi:hypothetical protein